MSDQLTYTVLYEEGPTSWGASVPDLPGVFAVGETYEEARELIREAIAAFIVYLRETGQPIPPPLHPSESVFVAA